VNARKIAGVKSHTRPHEWNKYVDFVTEIESCSFSANSCTNFINFNRYPEQQRSKPIGLEKGNVYYIDAFLKEGRGGDHLAVAVRLPSGSVEAPLMKDIYTRPPVGKFSYFALVVYLHESLSQSVHCQILKSTLATPGRVL
jgi:hypothetical protein